MIRKLLIANRGEIACRIVRTARRMGIATVAVFSDADAGALHVRNADQAVRIGPAAASESYLNSAALINAAQASGADAIHPGYGFLSEDAAFAGACREAGITFVGPSPDAIEAMGDKARAKAIAREADVPVVPGYDGADQTAERLLREAESIGFSLLIKALAGGGGRGMRRVDRPDEFLPTLDSARREAKNAFGDDAVLLEKLIVDARHVEVQVFGDRHGNLVHLGARDCSAQRRHQKIVEEAPSPFVGGDLRNRMGADAIRLARAVAYEGAGTVEFIVGADGSYHFLEMNTRLQVEHPVTEMVTGIDLVEWQIRVASGEALPLGQDDIRFDGHAIETRLYAEDPADGFRPQAGRIAFWRPDGARARVDSGYAEGDVVPSHYDPMIAKTIVHARDRNEAVGLLDHALRRAPLFGIRTNRDFLIDLIGSPEFAQRRMTTGVVDRWVAEAPTGVQPAEPDDLAYALAGVALALASSGDWFRSTGVATCSMPLRANDSERTIGLSFERGRLAAVEVNGKSVDLTEPKLSGHEVSFGLGRRATFLADGRSLWLDLDGRTLRFEEPDLLRPRAAAADPTRIVSPVAGMVRAVLARPGDRVIAGQAVGMVEAMKMETTLRAAAGGTVVSVQAAVGASVLAGDVVAMLDPDAGLKAPPGDS